MKLDRSKVYRGGVTSPYRNLETNQVFAFPRQNSELTISFNIASNGGGETNVKLKIDPKDFRNIVKAMCVVDRQEAMAAMSSELAEQVGQQPGIDDKTAKQAISKMCGEAAESWRKAPYGEDGTQKIVWDGVKKLASELGFA